MNLKEVTYLLGWTREKLEIAILEGIQTPTTKTLVRLTAERQSGDYDIKEEDVDAFLSLFEQEIPGRYPPISVRRELLVESGYQCGICKSDAPPNFHHIVDWAKLQHHDPAQMLSICGSCHDKIGCGAIDTKAQKAFKQRLVRSTVNSLPHKDASIAPPNPTPISSNSADRDLLDGIGVTADEFVTTEVFHESSAVWFHHERFTAAFPGVRGICEISAVGEAVERLSILLAAPLRWVWQIQDSDTVGVAPIWWWRGRSTMSIDRFATISNSEVLLNEEELLVRRVVAVNIGSYWQSFVYVETNPMPPVGIYESDPAADARRLELFGYVSEEYGTYQGRAVTRAEYDDGAAIIDGKPKQIPGAQLRVRFLTAYNFVIASQESPINNSDFDGPFEAMMNDILKGKLSVDELAERVSHLRKRRSFGA